MITITSPLDFNESLVGQDITFSHPLYAHPIEGTLNLLNKHVISDTSETRYMISLFVGDTWLQFEQGKIHE